MKEAQTQRERAEDSLKAEVGKLKKEIEALRGESSNLESRNSKDLESLKK